jgi:hypothetical protein
VLDKIKRWVVLGNKLSLSFLPLFRAFRLDLKVSSLAGVVSQTKQSTIFDKCLTSFLVGVGFVVKVASGVSRCASSLGLEGFSVPGAVAKTKPAPLCVIGGLRF